MRLNRGVSGEDGQDGVERGPRVTLCPWSSALLMRRTEPSRRSEPTGLTGPAGCRLPRGPRGLQTARVSGVRSPETEPGPRPLCPPSARLSTRPCHRLNGPPLLLTPAGPGVWGAPRTGWGAPPWGVASGEGAVAGSGRMFVASGPGVVSVTEPAQSSRT
ncbi:collagen alpha-1(III) chain-like [Leopardus geoffroyi]|uniref:collagen alpha-1(III) chain-like n=1 Tax=Leopardus geoffroyi TaxID=46844 RepID=UPI001E264A6D|nr:collagen alpha-1(III) chain-like [Leopardus geoffroyi]